MIDKKLDFQFGDNFWFSLGVHIDHKDPSITLHLPGVIVCFGNCKQPGFKYSIRRMLGLGGSPYVDNRCDCCERKDVHADLIPGGFTDHKGKEYNYLCNRCFAELGLWDEAVEDATPEQLDQILVMTWNQFEKDGITNPLQFGNGQQHYALRQLFYYYEVVLGGGYGE